MEEKDTKKIYLLVTSSYTEDKDCKPQLIIDPYETADLAIKHAKENFECQKRLEGEQNIVSHFEYDDKVLLTTDVLSGKRLYSSSTGSKFQGKVTYMLRSVYEHTILTK